MNKYIIMLTNGYDCYEVEEPYPVETTLTKEELLEDIRQFSEKVKERSSKRSQYDNISSIYHRLIDVGIILHSYDVNDWNGREKSLPRILTVDEWFEDNKNRDRFVNSLLPIYI